MQDIEGAAMDPLGTSPDANHGINGNGVQGHVAADELHTLMKKRLDEVPGEAFEDRPVTIFRLPTSLYETNKHFCEPDMVAIGPFHRDKKRLQTMEEHKWYTLRDFLARHKDTSLDVLCQAMMSIEAQARQCYSEAVNLGSNDFAMMLVLDGCFIIEKLLKKSCEESDKILGMGWSIGSIFTDILMSENQVPFFVIHKLWDTGYPHLETSQDCNNRCTLIDLICQDLKYSVYNQDQFSQPQIACKHIHHLLHFYYLGVVLDAPPQNQTKTKSQSKFWGPVCSPCLKLFSKSRKSHPYIYCSNILCVSELHDAGIKFKRKMKPRHMFDISFENGTIWMPYLYIDNMRMSTFWNMVVFEQSCYALEDFPQIFTSYLVLMDSLINTEKDVAILERSGILDNFSSNAEEAADFFNKFSNNFLFDGEFYFSDLYKNVKEYSESTWHRYRARLMQDYFSNPWSIISLVAAMILLVLTFVQTYYSAAK